jgi:hypothetical protein
VKREKERTLMQYQMIKLNSLRKRYVRPKTFPATLDMVGSRGATATLAFTLCDPRTKAGEGYCLYLDITTDGANAPLMASLIARIYSMMSPETREQFSIVVARENGRP